MAEKWEKAASNHGLEGSRISPWSSNSMPAAWLEGVKVAKGHTHRIKTPAAFALLERNPEHLLIIL